MYPKEQVLIEFDEKSLKQVLSEKYGLDPDTSTMTISHFPGDQRQSSSTNLIIKGVKKTDNTPEWKKH